MEPPAPADDLASVLLRIAGAASPRALWDLALDHFRARGIQLVTYHLFAPAGFEADERVAIAADGFPHRWVRAYTEERLFLVDPIPALARRRTEPFLWSEIADLVTLTPAERAFLDRRAAQELGDGLAMEVFGPGQRDGYVGLGFGGDPPDDLTPELQRTFQIVAQAAHLRYCDLVPPATAALPELSQRERDVLHWLARGKSNPVIAEILGLSVHTVDTHLRALFDKLGVADRTSAALRAVGAARLQFHAGDFS
jgi:LuxR family transcriptional regulator/LuxR family quorum-sensing system transcriptional regulator CciR